MTAEREKQRDDIRRVAAERRAKENEAAVEAGKKKAEQQQVWAPSRMISGN